MKFSIWQKLDSFRQTKYGILFFQVLCCSSLFHHSANPKVQIVLLNNIKHFKQVSVSALDKNSDIVCINTASLLQQVQNALPLLRI